MVQKRLATFIAVLAFCVSPALARSSGGRVSVKGHTTKKGVYVKPHQRTAPNKTQRDNWSAKGNTNPNTGKRGKKRVAR